MTARDFGIIYNSFLKFEEELVNALAMDDEEIDEEELEDQIDRLETLINRRPFLLNDVMIRANRNSVEDWLHRISLYLERSEIISVF